MESLLPAAGAAIILVTTLDIFFTVLFPASRHGPVRKPLSTAIWWTFRLLGRATSGPRRRSLLSYSGPVVIGATLVTWFVLLTLGFAMVFKPAMGLFITAAEGPTDTGWPAALYYAGFSLTTLGVGDITATTGGYRLLTVGAAATGFAYFSLSITYFLSVYSNLIGRNAFAQGLHHLTGRTGDAAELIARQADGDDLDSARAHLASKAAFLRQTHQSHAFYPVLRHFHYREPFYALPRILLTALDTAALLRSAIDRERYRALLASPALTELEEAADDLLKGLVPDAEPPSPSAADEAAWRRRFAAASERLAKAGIRIRTDAAAAAGDYVACRAEWDSTLHRLAGFMLYEWDRIEDTGQDQGRASGSRP